jgi:hypothetical protein
MLMSRFKTFTYTLPKFKSIKNYTDEGFYEAAERANNRYKYWPNRYGLLIRRFPWLKECLPEGATIIDGVNHVAPEQSAGNSFRSYFWHIDRSDPKIQLGVFATSTPTSFAACQLTIDTDAMMQIMPVDTQGTTKQESLELRDPGVFLRSYFGGHWLEKAAGLTDPHANLRSSVAASDICKVVVDVQDLAIVQAMPGVLATGPANTTLHTASVRHDSSSDTRALYRVLYTLPE